jgi:hypothetical protein
VVVSVVKEVTVAVATVADQVQVVTVVVAEIVAVAQAHQVDADNQYY